MNAKVYSIAFIVFDLAEKSSSITLEAKDTSKQGLSNSTEKAQCRSRPSGI
jgi:hypothetical protein